MKRETGFVPRQVEPGKEGFQTNGGEGVLWYGGGGEALISHISLMKKMAQENR